ncbi:MAG TPA: Xaa-Pro peptidase family protein [Parachlamydiaceae bacterium]|nr:Xaa-Pro peptidase family protein [Parachlamydiaceae bacterium]
MPYLKRQENLVQLLKTNGADALIVDDPVNLYYLTGLEMSSGKLLVTTRNSLLFADNRYYEMALAKSPYRVVLSDKEPLSQFLLANELNFIKTIAFDSENSSYKAFLELDALFAKLKEQSSGRSNMKLLPLENPVKSLRMIKDEEEIALLKKAADLGSSGFDHICTLLKEGITEIEVAEELEFFWKKRNGKKMAFDPIIAFGANGSMPHYRSGNAALKKGDAVLIDIGVTFQHYQSDMTRMVFFGTPQEQISIIHPIVQRAQKLSLEICKPGTLIKDIDAKARDFIAEQGYGENFSHGIGHGVGLEVHELPTMRYQSALSSLKLKPGMVLTIEPGIYLPKIGGVRIEDTIVITEDGHESLTKRPQEPYFIEP